MRRVFLFLIVGVLVITAAWGLANLPGRFSASVGSVGIETSTAVAIVALLVLFGIGIILLRLLQGLLGIPRRGARWRQQRRLKLGERSITRVLVALAGGEEGEARKEARKAQKFLGQSPQTLLLFAEANRLSGHEDEAERAFLALTKRDDAKFLGYRGLLRQAIDRRDWVAAEAIAREAEMSHPGTPWLRQQRAELALQTDNWPAAAELTAPNGPRAAYYVAAAEAEPDAARALKFARQAWKEDNAFTPAVLAYARRQRAMGRERRARSAVAEAWRLAPHPNLAEFVLAPYPDAVARFQQAKQLVASNPTNPESRILLARGALEASLTGEARHQTDAALAEGLNQRRLWLLIAEIEEKDRGDTEEGRVAQRDALRRAAVAERDPSWQCATCRSDHQEWQARCSSCGSVGTLHWEAGPRIAALPAVA